MFKEKLKRPLTVAVVLVFAVLATALPRDHASAQTTGLTILNGNGEPGYAVNLFLPNQVTIAEGTTLTWRNPWFEGHQVAFLGAATAPAQGSPAASSPSHPGQLVSYTPTTGFVNSGTMRRNDTFQMHFPTAGTYQYLCLTHRGPPTQAGTVTVVAAGSAGISTQAQLDAAATTTYNTVMTSLRAEATRLSATNIPARSANADWTGTWRNIIAGAMIDTSDAQQFFPPVLNIRAGDTVVWDGPTRTPHPVAFLAGGSIPAGGAQVAVLPPAAGWDGTTYINTGSFGAGRPAQTASVKFTRPGTYSYVCSLHFDQAMAGVINVSAAQIAPAPAKTGMAGLVEGNDGGWNPQVLLPLAVAGLAVSLMACARAFTGRRGR